MAQSSGGSGSPKADKKNDDHDKQSGASATREVAQSQVDRVAQVSRTATGEAHQNPGYEVIGLPEDATEAQIAAAENRPEKS